MLRRGDIVSGRELVRVLKVCDDPVLTKQEFSADADINNIISKFNRTGDLRLLQASQPYYGDVSNLPSDYLECLNIVKDANRAFDNLPAAVRSKFKNDPAAIIDFVADPNNKTEAIELGLIAKPPGDLGSPGPSPNASPAASGPPITLKP